MPTLTTLRRDAAYQVGIFVSGDGTRGIPYRDSLATKTVAVVGLAKSGVAAARLLRRLGARVLASDSGALESLTAEARALEREGVALWAGGHPDEAFRGAAVVAAPRLPGLLRDLEPLIGAWAADEPLALPPFLVRIR